MIILLSTIARHPLAEELASLGLLVRATISTPEVFSLVERFPNAPIIITADIQTEQAKIIQLRYPTLHLKSSATAREVLCEVSHIVHTTHAR